MNWYSGSVVDAIAQCRQQRAVFIVYIKDDTDASKQSDSSWNSGEVQQVLSSNMYVAIQIIKDSIEYQQFSQLFPVLLTPCVFCIGLTGDQLAVRSGPLDTATLMSMLQEAFLKHQSPVSGSSDHVEVGATNEDRSEDITDGQDTDAQTVATPNAQQRLQEKKQQIRQKRETEERQKEKDRENARRRDGQEITQWKRDKEELERQQILKERRRQKQEEQKARQEVLAKLEQDRQERASQKKLSSTPKEPPTTVHQATPTVTSNSTRIQVKMPQNQTTVLLLSSSDTVGTLRDQIAEYMEVESNHIILSCAYPRKQLTSDLNSTPLNQHGLVPSGVVIVRLTTSSGGSGDGPSSSNEGSSLLGSLWGLIVGLFQYLIMIIVYVKNAITGTTTSSDNDSQPSQQYRTNSSRIRRFNQDDFRDDDDEKRKNTYNGNSTQQL